MKAFRWLIVSLSIGGLLLVAFAGPGLRLGAWDLRTGFTLLKWGAYLGAAGAIGCVLALVFARRRLHALAVLFVPLIAGAIAFAVPAGWRAQARSVPPIHDISTDTQQPPAFRAILPLRAGAPNPATYGGESVAARQREAYPDIRPLRLSLEVPACFDRALAAARDMGWALVAQSPEEGRIEATATTFWFGFQDDVVIRVQAAEDGCRVDVRSVSRVGGSDVGTNARRIRAYMERLAG